MTRDEVVGRVKDVIAWWIATRSNKIRAKRHDSMELNPFPAPLLSALHGLETPIDIAEFVLGGHFYIGHGTGFGKMIDEKLLPKVFGTQKLDKTSRRRLGMEDPCFDNIDHVVARPEGSYLLSLKAGKWTIQKGQAVELNRSCFDLIERRRAGTHAFHKIIVATFYGSERTLTDKYRIVRGIATGAATSTVDVSADVEVMAGRKFWHWIGGHPDAQEWVLVGILEAVAEHQAQALVARQATGEVEAAIAARFGSVDNLSSPEQWLQFLRSVNP